MQFLSRLAGPLCTDTQSEHLNVRHLYSRSSRFCSLYTFVSIPGPSDNLLAAVLWDSRWHSFAFVFLIMEVA